MSVIFKINSADDKFGRSAAENVVRIPGGCFNYNCVVMHLLVQEVEFTYTNATGINRENFY